MTRAGRPSCGMKDEVVLGIPVPFAEEASRNAVRQHGADPRFTHNG